MDIQRPTTRKVRSTRNNGAVVALLTVALGIVISAAGAVISAESIPDSLAGLLTGIGLELISIGVIVLVIDNLIQRRSREDERRKLLLQMGSDNNDLAKEAVRILRLGGQVEDGTLSGVNLRRANLAGINLRRVDFSGADLWNANLEGAYLTGAKLINADLRDANLTSASLNDADLSGAELWNANLTKADLRDANLKGASLKDARLIGCVFSKDTIMPDGTNSTPGIDIQRFTDSDHKDFYDPKAKR